jgi:hypothetical protein
MDKTLAESEIEKRREVGQIVKKYLLWRTLNYDFQTVNIGDKFIDNVDMFNECIINDVLGVYYRNTDWFDITSYMFDYKPDEFCIMVTPNIRVIGKIAKSNELEDILVQHRFTEDDYDRYYYDKEYDDDKWSNISIYSCGLGEYLKEAEETDTLALWDDAVSWFADLILYSKEKKGITG